MKLTTLAGFIMAAGLVGCAGTGEVEYGGGVAVASPDLVEVEPGVQVLADADAPVFYSDGAYYEYRDGLWYRSGYYDRGFARVDINYVPMRVRTIDNPRAYVHYRRHEGNGYARPAPVYREREPAYRPSAPVRTEGGVYVTPGSRPAPGPVIRDHRRDERHDRDRDHDHDHDHH